MAWIQIVAFSLAAGLVLHGADKIAEVRRRRRWHLIFVIVFSVAITVAFGLQARIDRVHPVIGFLVPSMLIAALLCMEAWLVAACIRRYTSIKTLVAFLPVFLAVLWAVCFVTMTLMVLVYPGS